MLNWLIGLIALGCLLGVSGSVQATPPLQDLDSLVRQAELWLQDQAQARYPGLEAAAQVTSPDPRLRLPACAEPRFSLPPGSAPWGSGSLGMRCDTPHVWSLYTPYKISLRGPALVSIRSVAARQALLPQDVERRQIDYQAMPEVYLQDIEALSGSLLSVPVSPGSAIRHDMLRRPPLIKAGQRVQMHVEGPGFRVSQVGIAQQSGAIGASIRLKTLTGRIVQGTVAADGSVDIRH